MYRNYFNCYDNKRGLKYLEGEFVACKGIWDPINKLYINTTPEQRKDCCQKICELYKSRLPDCYKRCMTGISKEN